MSTAEIDSLKYTLALTIAIGRSVRTWAKQRNVDVETARQWSLQNEFRKLVDVARMRFADRLVGRLLEGARLAITQLVMLCTKSTSDAIRLAASRALLANWVKFSDHIDFGLRLTVMEERAERNAPRSGEWRPHSPRGHR